MFLFSLFTLLYLHQRTLLFFFLVSYIVTFINFLVRHSNSVLEPTSKGSCYQSWDPQDVYRILLCYPCSTVQAPGHNRMYSHELSPPGRNGWGHDFLAHELQNTIIHLTKGCGKKFSETKRWKNITRQNISVRDCSS